MKIYAFTDTHGSPSELEIVKKKSQTADLIICTGDFTIFENEIEYIMKQINNLPKKVLLLHGNHEDEATVEFLSKPFKNIEFLHKKIYEEKDFLFVSYGGGGFALNEPEFENWIKSIEKKLKNKKVILLLHGPPYGTKVDKLAMGQVGNKSFTKVIKKLQPKLVLCGHLHENFGKRDKIGKSIIINPGPKGELIKI